MTTALLRLKQLAANFSMSVWLEAFVALVLMALGLSGLLVATQDRPYLGEAATDLSAVPVRVITAPNIGALLIFIVALSVGLTGFAWFVMRLVHWRFFAPVVARRVWRQAVWVGVLALALAWLKINQTLTLPLAAIIILALVLIEVLLNVRVGPKSDEKL